MAIRVLDKYGKWHKSFICFECDAPAILNYPHGPEEVPRDYFVFSSDRAIRLFREGDPDARAELHLVGVARMIKGNDVIF